MQAIVTKHYALKRNGSFYKRSIGGKKEWNVFFAAYTTMENVSWVKLN